MAGIKETLRRHAQALDLFTERVHAIGEDQWSAPTPCTEWSVRDLVNHLTAEQLWVPPLLSEGSTIAAQGSRFDGDQLGDDPVAAWDRAAAGALSAFGAPGALERTVQLSYGETPAQAYCDQMTTDGAVHAWDLSRAIGADERLPKGLAAFVLREVEPYAQGLAASGLFGPPVKVPAEADDQTRLLGLLGRKA